MTQAQAIQDVIFSVRLVVGEWLADAGVAAPVVQIERSSNADFGEYAINAAMRYAKEIGRPPLEIAEELAARMGRATLPGVARVEVAKPGFINVYLTPEAKLAHAAHIIEKGASYGTNEHYSEEKWVIEHTSPNPNKAMHLGHLRNNLVGMSITRLLKASGATVVSDAIYNDRGIAIAKVMYGFLRHKAKPELTEHTVAAWQASPEAWYTPAELEQKPDVFITECYVLAEKDMEDAAIEAQVREYVVAWEADDTVVVELWKHVLSIAYEGIDRTLNRLGSHWDQVWYESDHYKKGKSYVTTGLEQGVFTETEDGAVVTNLEERYGITDTVVLKRDGTSLYITQDLALTDLKKRKYHADKLVWVVGPEQTLAFQQLFAVCEQLGIGRRDDFTHVTYGYVGLREDGAFKKMSSRAGTVVLIDEVIDQVREVIAERLREHNEDAADVAAKAETLALGAVKFAFLRSDRTQEMSFDITQSVDVSGDSGMYVLYTYARAMSLLNKSDATPKATTMPDAAADTVRTLLYYPEVIEKATADLSAHHVSQYLLELCGAFNSWYGQEAFLDGTDEEAARMAVVAAVAQTIKNGLGILGIDTVESF